MKKLNVWKKHKNLLIILGLSVLATIYFCYPYLNGLVIQEHDLFFHLARIQKIGEEIKAGNIPVLIHSQMVKGMGYGTPIFYPEIFLYIPAIIHLLGISTLTSYKIFIAIITWATFMSMFICTKKITKSNMIGVVATLLYTFSLYRITDIYTRGALGEVLVFIFLPIIVLGIYELTLGDKNKWWILPIGVFGVINSHIISAAFALGIIMYFIIINIKNVFKEKRVKYIVIAGIASILVSLSVILPILEQKNSGEFKVFATDKEKQKQVLLEHTLIPTQVFIDEYNYGLADDQNIYINSQMNFGIGTLLLILPTAILITKWNNKKEKRFIIQLFVLGLLSLIGTTQIFPWKYFAFVGIIQFVWRLNTVVTMCFAIVGAYSIYYAVSQKREIMLILAIIIIITASKYLGKVQYFDRYNEEVAYDNVSSGEYLPNVKINYDEQYIFDINQKETKYEYQKDFDKITFETTNEKHSKEINIPLIYYKGYEAKIKTQDNKTEKLKLSTNDNNGMMKLENEKELVGTITIEYKMTWIQRISYIITYATLISLLSCIIFKFYKKGRKRK